MAEPRSRWRRTAPQLRLVGAGQERAAPEAVPASLVRLDLVTLRAELSMARRLPRLAAAPPRPSPARGGVDVALLDAERRAGAVVAGPAAVAHLRAELQLQAHALAVVERRVADARATVAGAQARLAAERAEAATASPPSWLPDALARLLEADPGAAAALALELLPAQGLVVVEQTLDYDLLVEGFGCRRVLAGGGAATVLALASPRPGREVQFRLEADPAALVSLLLRGGRGRRHGPRVRATWRRRRARRCLPAAQLELGALARAGVWPDPGLLYRALGTRIDPEWTRGHDFCVAHEIAGRSGGTWYLVAAGGGGLTVDRRAPARPPDATVRSSRVHFQLLLAGERTPAGDRAIVTGDVRAPAAINGWIARAQRG